MTHGEVRVTRLSAKGRAHRVRRINPEEDFISSQLFALCAMRIYSMGFVLASHLSACWSLIRWSSKPNLV